MKDLLDLYLTSMKNAVMIHVQYRAASYFFLIGLVAEPIIYLVVWSTVAREQGGSVGGYTPRMLAAYYIVWTLVRNMNIVFTPYGWEWRIRRGVLSANLLRPVHPLHFDIAYFAGWKVVIIVMWLPLAALLTFIFEPELSPTPLAMVGFFFAIWGAYLVRSMFLWALGLITLWTTRVSAVFETYLTMELLLSGRLVPMSLLPEWVQQFAIFLPFQWAFAFPIEMLVGQMTPGQMLFGFGAQLLWVLVGLVLVRVTWHTGIKRYSAVGA